MPSLSSTLTLAALTAAVIAHPPSKQHHGCKNPSGFNWRTTTSLLAFGDSYTEVLGTRGYPNSTFLGSFLPGQLSYTPSELLSDYIVQCATCTAEGGPNWVQHLTDCGLQRGLTDPQECRRQLWDFAFGGADISQQWLERHHNYTVQLDEQVATFLEYGDATLAGPEVPGFEREDTLVGVWIGINDINDSADMEVDFVEFYNRIVGTLFESMQDLYDAGYKDFLFVNLPPLDRTPGNNAKMEGEPKTPTLQQITWYNEALYNQSQAFGARNADAEVMVYDANTFLNGVMDHPHRYGFEDVEGYCLAYNQPYVQTDPWYYGCMPLEKYFWYNNGHATSRTHEVLAEDIERFLRRQGGC